MINIKYLGKRYKIYANGKIKCLDKDSEADRLMLETIVTRFGESYRGSEHGFLVSNMANSLPKYGIEVISYRDYEMENAKPDTIY